MKLSLDAMLMLRLVVCLASAMFGLRVFLASGGLRCDIIAVETITGVLPKYCNLTACR